MSTRDEVVSLLQTLPPRPPTPPREAASASGLQTRQPPLSEPVGRSLDIQTPPNAYSPRSSRSTNLSSSRRARKKVGFSSKAEYKDPPAYTDCNAGRRQPSPLSLPSSSSKPVKSILKVTGLSNSPDVTSITLLDPIRAGTNLGTMLNSTIQQLAGPDRESRLDAYMALAMALKASSNLPDRVALQGKMSLFTHYIQRDMTCKAPGGAVDSPLASQALGLLVTFFSFPAIGSTLSNDFGVFVVDHCIRSFEDPSVPKDVLRRMMQVVALQTFSPKVMTSDRVARLVLSLRKIDERHKGRSIIASRVHIYRKLVRQSKQLMVVHSDWLFDLFADMLSNLKDVRSAAIALGLEAAYALGKEKALSRKTMEILNLDVDEKKYIDYYQERLQVMAKEKTDSPAVPQIWSVVMLLLRCQLDKWDHFSHWLLIIQTCFNSSDYQTKLEANLAWSRLVYLVHADDRSLKKMVSTLSQPLIAQLKRKGSSGRPTEELRKVVVGGICNLLYYAFRPATNPALLDGYWTHCVDPLMRQLLGRKAENAADGFFAACAILTGLFDCTTQRLWREDRVTEAQLVRPDELPSIDSKWVRQNAARVFGIVEPILQRDFAAIADADSPTNNLWRTLATTVASAASKEIKVSTETASFVAQALNLLRDIWRHGPVVEGETGSGPRFLQGVLAYLGIMADALGHLPFTEKLLSVDKENHLFPVTTPTHRSAKSRGTNRAPIYHLFSILSTPPPNVDDDELFATFFSSAFAPFFATKTAKGQMDLAQDLMLCLPMDAKMPYGPWLLVAEKISAWLESGQRSLQTNGPRAGTPVGHEYQGIVRVLERGLRSTPNLPWTHWQSLFSWLDVSCREDVGDAGLAIVAVEPLAEVLAESWPAQGSARGSDSDVAIKCTIQLLYAATQPRDRQAVDAARRRLWGTVVSGSRSASFDVFDNLYRLVDLVLVYLYQEAGSQTADSIQALLKGISGFLDRSNPQLVWRSLAGLQRGLALWVRDGQAAAPRRQPVQVVEAIKSLWDRITGILVSTDGAGHLQLENLECLLCAAFGSKHRYIANRTLSVWNTVFGSATMLEYPDKLKAVLLSLRSHADIVLPGLEGAETEPGTRQPSFIDSQDDPSLSFPFTRSIGCGTLGSASRPAPPSGCAGSPPLQLSAARRRSGTTPNRRSARRQGATPRFRHNDSQLQFTTIDSSPASRQKLEPQLLTEHQREVLERQKEDMKMFPQIRSSASKGESPASTPSRPLTEEGLHGKLRAGTPTPEGTYDDFVTTTPTPRRGQSLSLVDQDNDLTDPPSSPPEPRRNLVFTKAQSRPASSSLVDEWQFSSSPLSGSPAPDYRALSSETFRPEHLMDTRQSSDYQETEAENEACEAMGHAEPQLPMPAASDDGLPVEQFASCAPRSPTKTLPSPGQESAGPADQRQSSQTPRGSDDARDRAVRSAPTRGRNPASSPTAIQAGQRPLEVGHDCSLVMSEVDERSMLRLVVELDSGNPDSSDYQQLADSPEKGVTSDAPLECIVVGDDVLESPEKLVGKHHVPLPVQAADVEVGTTNPQDKPGSGRKSGGRKGPATNAREGGKKRKLDETGADELSRSVSGSQQSTDSEGIRLRNGRMTKKRRPSTEGASTMRLSWGKAAATSSSSGDADQEEWSSGQEVMMRDSNMEDVEDYEVQSQLAQEVEAHSVRRLVGSADRDASMAGVQDQAAEPGAASADEEGAGPAKEESIFCRIVSTLQSGLNALRTARLSREEVYQVEDVFMDMKRELYEAERRGRAQA